MYFFFISSKSSWHNFYSPLKSLGFYSCFISFQPRKQKWKIRKSTFQKLLPWIPMPRIYIKEGSMEILPEGHERWWWVTSYWIGTKQDFLLLASHGRNSFMILPCPWICSKMSPFIKSCWFPKFYDGCKPCAMAIANKLAPFDHSITYSRKVTWHIKYVISALALDQWTPSMARWWLILRDFQP